MTGVRNKIKPPKTALWRGLQRMTPWICFGILLVLSLSAFGQKTDTTSFNQPIQLGDIVIRAQKNGFDIKSFIRRIEEDTTFYKAFRSMRLQTFNAVNDIEVYNKKGTKIVAAQKSETKQIYRDGCRTMNVLYQKTTGNFYKKNGDYRYYTAQLFAKLFFTKGKICGENNIVAGYLEKKKVEGNRIQKSIVQLEYLMFFPGKPVPGVPFVGHKVAIFEPRIAKWYNFKLTAETKNGVPCYLFQATPKREYQNKAVIKNFKTWLRQSDDAIISRDYTLADNTVLFDFDVKMHVDLSEHKGQLLPTFISYQGNWHILFKPREIVAFTASFDY